MGVVEDTSPPVFATFYPSCLVNIVVWSATFYTFYPLNP